MLDDLGELRDRLVVTPRRDERLRLGDALGEPLGDRPPASRAGASAIASWYARIRSPRVGSVGLACRRRRRGRRCGLAGGAPGAGDGAGAGCAWTSPWLEPIEDREGEGADGAPHRHFPTGFATAFTRKRRSYLPLRSDGKVGAHRRVVDDLHLDVDLVVPRDVDGEARALRGSERLVARILPVDVDRHRVTAGRDRVVVDRGHVRGAKLCRRGVDDAVVERDREPARSSRGRRRSGARPRCATGRGCPRPPRRARGAPRCPRAAGRSRPGPRRRRRCSEAPAGCGFSGE